MSSASWKPYQCGLAVGELDGPLDLRARLATGQLADDLAAGIDPVEPEPRGLALQAFVGVAVAARRQRRGIGDLGTVEILVAGADPGDADRRMDHGLDDAVVALELARTQRARGSAGSLVNCPFACWRIAAPAA